MDQVDLDSRVTKLLDHCSGEPTLALDVIEYISANLIEYCIDNGLDYSAGIITNGYLLTRETVSLLNKFKVQFYQIRISPRTPVLQQCHHRTH